MIDKDMLDKFRNSIGLFAIVDYITPEGIATAKGKLISVSESGKVSIQHLNNPQVSWGFKIDDIENYKLSTINERCDEDAAH